MLQALKVDTSASRPPLNRDREVASDLQAQAFSGYLATAASFTVLPGPAPAATPAPRPERSVRPEAPRTTERAAPDSERPEARRTREQTEGTAPRDRVEDAQSQAKASATASQKEEAPADSQDTDPTKAKQAEPATRNAVRPESASQPPLPTPSAMDLAAAKGTPQAEGAQPATPGATPQTLKVGEVQPESVAAQGPFAAVLPKSLPLSKAQAALEQAAPGTQLRFHFSEGAPSNGSATKPALTELLSLPRPEMETPKPVFNAQRIEVQAPKEAPTPAAPTATPSKDVSAAPTPATPVTMMGREAILAPAPKAEALPGRTLTGAEVQLGAAGPATVRGTTPVQAAGMAEGAKANATFTQMDGTIRWLIKNQEKGAEIQLSPESLGRVVIKLRIEGGEVHARLWASEASTIPLLQDQKAALEASLKQQGLSLGSFDLQQGRRGDDAQMSQGSEFRTSGAGIAEGGERKQDVPIAVSPALGGARLLEVFA